MQVDDYSRWGTDDSETRRLLARYPAPVNGGSADDSAYAGGQAWAADVAARRSASRAELPAGLSTRSGASGGAGTVNAGSELVQLNHPTFHLGGDSWNNVQPLWNDQTGTAVMPQAGVPITGNLREIRGPAVPYPYPEQLPSGGTAVPLVDDAGHLYYRVSAPGMEKLVSAPYMAAGSREVQRIEITGQRVGVGESYVSALGEIATSAVEGVQNLGRDAWDRSLANAASMMGIRGNHAGPARSGLFQRVDRIGWPGAVVITGLQASALGPYESLGAAGSASVDTVRGLAMGNTSMTAHGASQLTVMAAGLATGPMLSRVGAVTLPLRFAAEGAALEFKGARGLFSTREFDPSLAGGPLRELSAFNIRFTEQGISVVERHTSRFGPDAANEYMIGRLRQIANGDMEATSVDRNFYSHELREYVRYRQLGWEVGQPADQIAARELWNNTHTATLEEYRIPGPNTDPYLYHPDAIKLMEGY